MILKKILIENLRSYEKQEINFPTGSTLLSGDIGVGKTSVLLAIEFALFGLQPSQRGASLLRSGANNGKVVLGFEIEGKEIIIERTLKRGKKTVSQDYASITINDEKFEGSITEIKAKVLNDLYRYDYITKQEVISILKFDFDIEITDRKIKYFREKGVIEPGLKFKLPGVPGKVSFYRKNTS